MAQGQLWDHLSHRGASLWKTLAAIPMPDPGGYISGLGEDSSRLTGGEIRCPARAKAPESGGRAQAPGLPKTAPETVPSGPAGLSMAPGVGINLLSRPTPQPRLIERSRTLCPQR